MVELALESRPFGSGYVSLSVFSAVSCYRRALPKAATLNHRSGLAPDLERCRTGRLSSFRGHATARSGPRKHVLSTVVDRRCARGSHTTAGPPCEFCDTADNAQKVGWGHSVMFEMRFGDCLREVRALHFFLIVTYRQRRAQHVELLEERPAALCLLHWLSHRDDGFVRESDGVFGGPRGRHLRSDKRAPHWRSDHAVRLARHGWQHGLDSTAASAQEQRRRPRVRCAKAEGRRGVAFHCVRRADRDRIVRAARLSRRAWRVVVVEARLLFFNP